MKIFLNVTFRSIDCHTPVACGKYSGECTKAPWISNTGTVIHDKIEFEQW